MRHTGGRAGSPRWRVSPASGFHLFLPPVLAPGACFPTASPPRRLQSDPPGASSLPRRALNSLATHPSVPMGPASSPPSAQDRAGAPSDRRGGARELQKGSVTHLGHALGKMSNVQLISDQCLRTLLFAVVYVYNGILFGLNEEGNPDTCKNTNEPGSHAN